MRTVENKPGSRRVIIIALTAIYFFAYFHRVAVPGTVFNELQSDFKVSASAITMLGAIALYIYASVQLLAGILADRLGAARVLLAGGFIMTAAAFGFPLAHSFWMLYLTQGLIGLGSGLVFVSLVKELDELFAERHFAMVLSVMMFFGYTGGLAGTFPLERAVSVFGWRTSFFAAAAASLITVVAAYRLFHQNNRLETANAEFDWRRIKDIACNRRAWPLVFTGSAVFAIYFLLQSALGKKLLQDCRGFSSAAAASFTFALLLVNMIGAACSGFASRLIGNRRKPLLICVSFLSLLAAIMLVLILNGILPSRLMLSCYVVWAISACASPLFCSAVKEVSPPDAAASSVGFVNTIAYGMVALLINASGLVMDSFKSQAHITSSAIIYPPVAYSWIFLGCSGIAAISLLLAFFIPESWGQNIYQPARAAQAHSFANSPARIS